MRIIASISKNQSGYALLLVLILMSTSLMILAGIMKWTDSRARIAERNRVFTEGLTASEAAVEKVISAMTWDYLSKGETNVYSSLSQYRRLIPDSTEDLLWKNYDFFDDTGTHNQIGVDRVTSWSFGDIPCRFPGLRGTYATYRVTSNSRQVKRFEHDLSSSVSLDVQLVAIPIFAFEVYYAPDMEINPSDKLSFNGRVHGNSAIYCQPNQARVTFQKTVTAVGDINPTSLSGDPIARQGGSIVYQTNYETRVKSLKIPLGNVQTPSLLRALIQPPPAGESRTSVLGQERFYNKADLFITVASNGVRATSGSYNNFADIVPWSLTGTFLNTNAVFFDRRENREVLAVEIDVNAFNSQTVRLKTLLRRDVKTIYVFNQASCRSDQLCGIRLVNGETLPATGLSVATPNPLYVLGHYNVYLTQRASHNTTKAMPAALIADAITILSGNWKDNRSRSDLTARQASRTTVNAGIITGIVPTRDGFYSGGVENCVRLLEDWRDTKLTFNGSLVVLFESLAANTPWGANDEVYDPPVRDWAWDVNFATESKIPPGTPQLRTVFRSLFSAGKSNVDF